MFSIVVNLHNNCFSGVDATLPIWEKFGKPGGDMGNKMEDRSIDKSLKR
ncbi:MAG TPA: hypothetical protein VFF57_02995 [Hanamia sp.]|nr:hypothetical protein [Hanamia sp.]